MGGAVEALENPQGGAGGAGPGAGGERCPSCSGPTAPRAKDPGKNSKRHLRIEFEKPNSIEIDFDPSKIEYIEIVDRTRLDKLDFIDKPALAAIAVIVGKTRLIDNIEIDF